MALLFKRLLWSVLALLLVVGVALAVFLATFDPNDYKSRITEYVSANTGREFTMGDVGLSLLPYPNLAVARVTLADAPHFGDEPFLEAREMRIALELLPLLSGEVRLGDVALKGAHLRLARDQRGRNNWQDLLGARAEDSAGSAPEAEAAPAPADGRADAGAGFGLAALGRIEWEDSSIAWRDARNDDAWDVRLNALRVGAWEAARPARKIPLYLSATARRASGLEASVDLKAQVSFDRQKGVRLEHVAAKIDADGLPGGVRVRDATVEAALTLTEERIAFDELVLAFDDCRLSASGVFELRGEGSQHRLQAQARSLPLETAYALLADNPQPPLRGDADVRLTLTARGDDDGLVRRSLGGDVAVSVPDARYRNAALAESVERAAALLPGREPGARGGELTVSSASATIAFARGVGDNRDLAIDTLLFDVTGAGQFDLAHLRTDYTLYLQSKQDENMRIPIRVTGDFDNLDYEVEYSSLVKPLLDKLKDKLRLPF